MVKEILIKTRKYWFFLEVYNATGKAILCSETQGSEGWDRSACVWVTELDFLQKERFGLIWEIWAGRLCAHRVQRTFAEMLT